MSAAHTPGRLHTGGDGTIVYAADGWAVCNTTVFYTQHGGPKVAKANARRLAACWNACEGIDTEHLEKNGLPAFAPTISDLRTQRDTLLAACRQAEPVLADLEGLLQARAPGFTGLAALQALRDAMAKATG